jgi:hypothetical protein
MFKNMTEEDFFPYGDEFESLKQVEEAVQRRIDGGLMPIRGAAVFWSNEKGQTVRNPVRILPDGSPSFAHAEYI